MGITPQITPRKLTFNIITNNTNGLGLQRDAELLKKLIESQGHIVVLTHFQSRSVRQCDVNIFLELIAPLHLPHARENWFFPNSEWYMGAFDEALPQMGLILCKTKDCLDIWTKKAGARAVYVGFEANDFFNPETPRQKKFLHLAGGSSTKNTAAVVSAWRFPYSLTVVSYGAEVRVPRNVPNVRVTARIPESEVHQLLNECQYHIMPSMYEGYGHSLHESIGCGAVIITTDAPPMNEFIGIDKNLLVPVLRRDPCRLGHLNWVSPDSVAVAVQRALEMTDDQIKAASQAARDGFVQDRDFFRSEFANIVQAASERVNKNQVLPMPPLPPQSPQSPQPPQSPQRVRRVYTNNGLTIDWWSRHPRA